MAFSVRVEAYRFPATSPMLTIEVSWWNTRELMDDERFKYQPEMQGYDDYIAVLKPCEFRELHHRYRKNAFWPSGTEEYHYPALPMLDAIADYLSDEYHHFRVTVFEWDSGLGD